MNYMSLLFQSPREPQHERALKTAMLESQFEAAEQLIKAAMPYDTQAASGGLMAHMCLLFQSARAPHHERALISAASILLNAGIDPRRMMMALKE
jgi:hypothetical protein